MFGLGDGDEDKERMWNFLLFSVFLSDDEIEEAGPSILITAIIVVVLVVGAILIF